MRLATIRTASGTSAALLEGADAVVLDDHEDVGALLKADPALETVRGAKRNGNRRRFSEGDLLRPVLRPGAIVCVGLNYRTHILEMGRELPDAPTLFTKLARSLTDPYAEIALPEISDKVDYEAELAVVIGRGGRGIARVDAWDHVAGLTVLNDVTMRDYQRRTMQWFAGKTLQESTPMGPWIVTPDELGDLGRNEVRLHVNGEERQRAPLSDLVFGVDALIADLSRIVALEPGDVIATGTPGGVGEPKGRFLGDGDVVEVAIDGIGAIRNTFRTAPR